MIKSSRILSSVLMAAMVVTSSVSVFAEASSFHQNSQAQAGISTSTLHHQLTINGLQVSQKGAPVYVNKDGVTMIPLRTMAEKMGYKVVWNQKTKSIEVMKGAHWSAVTLGVDQYNFGKMFLSLGSAPEYTKGITYVPLAFAEQVLKAQVSIDSDGGIKIDDLMHTVGKKGVISKITHDTQSDQVKGSILVNGYANGMILYITDETILVNQENQPLSINDLRLGTSVEFVHESIMTMSQPPMTSAKKIVVHDKDIAPEVLGTAGEVLEVSTSPDGNTKVRIKGEKLSVQSFEEIVLNLNKETPIIDAKDQLELTVDALKKGVKVYGFYGPFTTKSLPPIGQAIKIVVENIE